MTSPILWGQLISILFMAAALGLDALSMGIGIGMKGIRKLHILAISALVAVFHMIMPLAGMAAGGFAGKLLGQAATLCGGVLLILLGAHMLYNTLKGEDAPAMNYSTLWGMVVYAFSVSIDSLSVGVSLGMFAGDPLLTAVVFGITAGIMSIAGLLMGSRVGSWIGHYGEALGGMILLAFGIRFLI